MNADILKLLAVIAAWISVFLLKTLVDIIKAWNKNLQDWQEKTDTRLNRVESEILIVKEKIKS